MIDVIAVLMGMLVGAFCAYIGMLAARNRRRK